jgi:hypothetical protein
LCKQQVAGLGGSRSLVLKLHIAWTLPGYSLNVANCLTKQHVISAAAKISGKSDIIDPNPPIPKD